jgi:hypothetical protein
VVAACVGVQALACQVIRPEGGDTLKRELQPSRAAVVVPNGTLYDDGAGAEDDRTILGAARSAAVQSNPIKPPFRREDTNVFGKKC